MTSTTLRERICQPRFLGYLRAVRSYALTTTTATEPEGAERAETSLAECLPLTRARAAIVRAGSRPDRLRKRPTGPVGAGSRQTVYRCADAGFVNRTCAMRSPPHEPGGRMRDTTGNLRDSRGFEEYPVHSERRMSALVARPGVAARQPGTLGEAISP